MKEFRDKEIQGEYDFLKMQEDDLIDELDRVQRRIEEIEATEEEL